MTDKKKILLADDEEDIKTTLKLYLESIGFTVDTAYDGLDALDKVKTFMPDLILLDIMMPLVDGIEVCKKVKSDPATNSIKVVMLSAASTKESYLKAKGVGADDFVVKPFEYPDLEATVKKILEIQ